MTSKDKAIQLAEKVNFYVFPVRHGEDNTKTPLTKRGHLDASNDPEQIEAWWQEFPNAKVGVACGASNLNVIDVDTKNGVDGWTSIEEAWLDLGTPYAYETGTGGSHLVYRAPEGVTIGPTTNYRKMPGVDRRAGSSWVLWTGGIPEESDLTASPEWTLDEVTRRIADGFTGTIQEWYDSLMPGNPNVMVRRAIKNVSEDMSHSDMVSATYEAIRLGAEGSTGVPALLEALEEAWMTRPVGNHTTPEEKWEYKFQEALLGGLEKYGETTELYKNLSPYHIGMAPASIQDSTLTQNTGNTGFSKLLGQLIEAQVSDDKILSILWNAPATKDIARDWGLEFCNRRIQEARVKPEPVRENPKLEELKEAEQQGVGSVLCLLTDQEREYIRIRPTFVDYLENIAIELGYDQIEYFHSIGWSMASMAFGFKGFVPVSATQKHGLNLWNIIMGYSGTGKSVARNFRDQVLRIVFNKDNEEGGVSYDLGTDSSPQGLHLALLERDGKASLFSADEASGFFKTLGKRDWDSGLEDTLSDWYMGWVAPSNKISLKDMRGKSAQASFNMQMFATPDRLAETLTRDQFKSGFLARVMWSFGRPKVESDEMFDIFKDSLAEVEDITLPPAVIQSIAADLISARNWIETPQILVPTPQAQERMSEAYRKMYSFYKNKENWDIIEPAITRHMEAMLKCAGICALYREDTEIILEDALHAIKAVESWLKNLYIVADMISAGQFQRQCADIELWMIEKGGNVTRSALFHRFRNIVQRDVREIDNLVSYLIEAGTINREETANGGVRYSLNGRA